MKSTAQRAEIIKLLDLAKRRIAAAYESRLKTLVEENAQLKAQLFQQQQQKSKTHDNCPGEEQNILWKTQLAVLRGGVQQRQLSAFGESVVKKWLKDQGHGCGGAKARKLISRLEDEGELHRGPDGKLRYPEATAKAA